MSYIFPASKDVKRIQNELKCKASLGSDFALACLNAFCI